MGDFYLIAGFILAAYSIIANDSIQTLGTFLASNKHRHWWILWAWISGLTVITVILGWLSSGGDPAFGRLTVEGKNIPHPHAIGATISFLFVIPPLALVILTRMGIPVSTSLLVLTAFKALVAQQQAEDPHTAVDLFAAMMEKSLVGYGVAFILGLLVYLTVVAALERKIHAEDKSQQANRPGWMVFQWCSTGFLWCMWLVQDLANIYVYLPRTLSLPALLLSLAGMVLLQGYMFKEKGGKIQKVVTKKTNTVDVRSACIIDLVYGLLLLFFKVDYIPKLFHAFNMTVPWPEKMPMSTTWVFLGLLAGREIGIAVILRHRRKNKVSNMVFADAGRAFIGSVVAIGLALFLPIFAPAPSSNILQEIPPKSISPSEPSQSTEALKP